jgi:hypothetical protein
MSLPDTREASSRGAVLLALATIGRIKSMEQISTPKGTHFTFRQRRRNAYNLARKKHQKMYENHM